MNTEKSIFELSEAEARKKIVDAVNLLHQRNQQLQNRIEELEQELQNVRNDIED
jgi:prefoldin subunit 5